MNEKTTANKGKCELLKLFPVSWRRTDSFVGVGEPTASVQFFFCLICVAVDHSLPE